MKTIRCEGSRWRCRASGALVMIVASSLAGAAAPSASDEYYFDPALLADSPLGRGLDLSRFNGREATLPDGLHSLDIHLNQQPHQRRQPVRFRADSHGKTAPCLNAAQVKHLGLRQPPPVSEPCQTISGLAPGARWQLDMAALRLDIQIPQAALEQQPRGYIPVSAWDAGVPVLYLRHNSQFYRSENGRYRDNTLWSNLNGGANLGLWQWRHQGNGRFQNGSAGARGWRYQSVKTWLQRPLPWAESELTLGESYTNSSLFGSLSFRGIKLATDGRMRPQARRGYAPEVRGVAASSARVRVRQQGRVIYETTVAPGPFVIDDLYNTQNQGDLQIEVAEADGQVSAFTVPYASVPDSMRPGVWQYSLASGRVRNIGQVNNQFVEATLQRGLSNRLTMNAGWRQAADYRALLLGTVTASRWGALGLNAVHSQAGMGAAGRERGWRLETSYSQTFASETNLVLAAWRYSTHGYRDLQDVLGVRRAQRHGVGYRSDTLNQRTSLSATVSQPLNSFGALNLVASTSDYYGKRGRSSQLQLGYSTEIKGVSLNINLARQRVWRAAARDDQDERSSWPPSAYSRRGQRDGYTENTLSVGISLPFSVLERPARVAVDTNSTRAGNSTLASMSGSAGHEGNTSWSLYSGFERLNGQHARGQWGGNIQRRTALGGLSASASRGEGYRQYSVGHSGTWVLHQGGITPGPYSSDTFALVHAAGAQGATLRNGQGAAIDRFGYAVMPSLTPYRYNDVSLEPGLMASSVELQGGSERVVPYAGAVARVDFVTLRGVPVLIASRLASGDVPPMGAEVLNDEGLNVGMVGQGGQIYARLAQSSGRLLVRWGPETSRRCRLDYRLPAAAESAEPAMVALSLPCKGDAG